MATKFPDLSEAAAAGVSLDDIQKMLAQGCDVNAVDAKGYSALMRAADKGQVDVMRLLIERGANVHAHTMAGRSVLFCATASGSVDAVRLALDSGAAIEQKTVEKGTTALHFAAALGHVAIMQLLIERGANPEATAKNGRTILHSAVERGRLDALRYALRLKTDVNRSAEADWETPLYLTTQSKDHKTVLQLAHELCSHGAVWSLACQQRIADQAVPKSDGKEVEAKAKQGALWRAGLVACITFWVKAYKEGAHGVAEIPVEVVERGAESIKTYLGDFGRSDANELVSRCKVCVLGPTGSGKTSLIRSLAAMQPTLTQQDALPDGIELLTSTFTDARADQPARRLDVTFWDFPGQDVHQLAHSLFFSRRTLFVVTVDLPAYMSQLDNSTGLSDDQFEFAMNRFVTTRVFRWVRTILSQQPDAHILFAGTKEDSLKDPKQAREVWIDLKDRLEDWKQSYIQELQAQFCTDPDSDSDTAHSVMHRVPSFHVDQDDQTAFTLESLKKKLAGVGTWLVVSSTDANSIANAREKVQELLSDAELGFPMWKTCMQVHEAIRRKCATARASGSERECLEGMIVRLSVLRKQLMREIDSLEREDCEHIIRSLDDLGDVLWFEREDAGELNDYVILDPKLGIEIVNEVINHDFSSDPQGPPQDGFLRHARLQTFAWWREMDIVLTHSFKALLQCFHLVFPAENEEMLPESDLIVPAFWKAYPPASSHSLLVRQQSKLDSIAKNRWCWEYEVPAGIADALYEKLAVQTSTSYLKRAISANCIECARDEFASRITLIEGEGTTDVVRIEVAGEGAEMSWHNMRYYLMKMEMVLEAYPGMTTRRYVVDTKQVMERRYALEPAVKKLLDTIALGRDEQLVRADFPWFPSDMTWYLRKSWKDIGAFQQLQLDQLVRDKLEVLRKLAIAGDAPRRYPALWSLEYCASERKVVLRMSSDLSGRCFHVPIEMEANPAFLAKYGAVLKEGLSVCAGIVADAIPLPFVGTVIDAALSVYDTKVQETTKVHNLIDRLDMAASNKFESHTTALSPGAATAVLRDLLRMYNDSMDDLEISELTNLELAVTANGEYVWAHAHEIAMLKDQITRCASPPSTWADMDEAADPSLSPTHQQAQSRSTLAVGSKHAASRKISFCISSVTGLAPSDWNKAYCKWQVSYGKSVAPLAMGATSQHADSGAPPTWRHVTIALDAITSVEMLRECRLRVRVKRRTRLGWTKVFGGSEVPLRDYVDEDAEEQFHCEPIDIAIDDASPPTQWATVEFFVEQ